MDLLVKGYADESLKGIGDGVTARARNRATGRKKVGVCPEETAALRTSPVALSSPPREEIRRTRWLQTAEMVLLAGKSWKNMKRAREREREPKIWDR